MKNLILIGGTMGVGKTATCRELQTILTHNVFLDGDWCWDMQPFVVNEETKTMVLENICFLLNQFLKCSQYKNIIFSWVMHEQAVIDAIVSSLPLSDCQIHTFSLVADESSIVERLTADVENGLRTPDVIERSVARIDGYDLLNTEKIDVSKLTAAQAAQHVAARVLLR